jgi:uncharacterized protein (DUF2141 family)
MTRLLPSIAAAFGIVALVQAASGHRVIVRIEGFRSDAGHAFVALHASSDGFPGAESAARVARTPIAEGETAVTFDAVAPGTYAVAVVHDENGNGKLDTNLLGIPREGVGASNGAQGRFGAARFDDAEFTLSGDVVIPLAIVYFDFF